MCQILEEGKQNISAETKMDIHNEPYSTQSHTIKCVETYVTEIDTALIQQEFMGFVKNVHSNGYVSCPDFALSMNNLNILQLQ
jgi:hypothetical protein